MLIPLGVFGQRVTIQDVVQKDQKIYVSYTLDGDNSYEVNLFYSASNKGGYWIRAYKLSGDYGEKQRGSNKIKTIVWDVGAEKQELVGIYDFKVTAKLDNVENKSKVKNKLFLSTPSASIHISSNIFNSPFGLSCLIPFYSTKRFGYYIEMKSDFRVYAPGEWALRDRDWINTTIGGVDTGADVVSDGRNDFTLCFSAALSNKRVTSVNGLVGLTYLHTPVFDEFLEPSRGKYYYAKSHSISRISPTCGFLTQSVSGFAYGCLLRHVGFTIFDNRDFDNSFDNSFDNWEVSFSIGFTL
jgi:hypothetical protein